MEYMGNLETLNKACCTPHNTESPNKTKNTIISKPLPIGVSSFKKVVCDYYYVDKTLLIKDVIDNKSEVTLFTRPRRFGKTLNMDMLRVFFENSEENNAEYFKDKLIWECGEKYTSYQGKYPVIFISFKDVKCSNWQETFDMIKKLISLEFRRHSELQTSELLNEYEKKLYTNIASELAGIVDYRISLQILSLLLHKHYNKQTIIIIDEYDTPIQQGDSCGFYNNVINFMTGFFSAGLKDNINLKFGFLTGILCIPKESIFSCLNNVKVCSILDKEYSSYFGFTKKEIEEVLEYYNYSNKLKEVCSWYDGYLFGDTEIFNPWSVINYIAEKCETKAFWQSTGSNDIIGEIISVANKGILDDLKTLLSGKKITTFIDTNVIYPEIKTNPNSVYSFLLVTGYLRVLRKHTNKNARMMYDVCIPNKEILYVYEKEVLNKFDKNDVSISVQQAILSKDISLLQQAIEDFLLDIISYHDTTNESFYHGLLLGLCATLDNRYSIQSNRESGYGRFDIQLVPKSKALPGFIFELKYAKTESEDLDALANDALKQIESQKYDEQMKKMGISDIIYIGIAFHGKKVSVKRI